MRMAAGDLAGADTALQGLDKFNGFQPLKVFQLGLLYDFAGKTDKAQQYYEKALGGSQQLNWRLTEAVANFEERHGRTARRELSAGLSSRTAEDLALPVARRATRPGPVDHRSAAEGSPKPCSIWRAS